MNTSAFCPLDLFLLSYILVLSLFRGLTTLRGPWPHYCWGFEIICRHTTLGRTALKEESACRREHQQGKDIHAPGGIGTLNPSKRVTADPRLRPHGHWDQRLCTCGKSLEAKTLVLRDVKVRFFTAYETGHYARQAFLQDLASYLIL